MVRGEHPLRKLCSAGQGTFARPRSCCPNAEAGAIDSAIQPCDALVAVSSLPSDILKRNAAAGENLAWSRERHPWITFSLAHPQVKAVRLVR